MFNAEGSDRFIENSAFVFTFHSDTNEDINLRKKYQIKSLYLRYLKYAERIRYFCGTRTFKKQNFFY